jgi:hypothetical protein
MAKAKQPRVPSERTVVARRVQTAPRITGRVPVVGSKPAVQLNDLLLHNVLLRVVISVLHKMVVHHDQTMAVVALSVVVVPVPAVVAHSNVVVQALAARHSVAVVAPAVEHRVVVAPAAVFNNALVVGRNVRVVVTNNVRAVPVATGVLVAVVRRMAKTATVHLAIVVGGLDPSALLPHKRCVRPCVRVVPSSCRR